MVKNEEQLIGIKAIARYLDMSVRNVYLWEKKLGLPLHRISGHTGYRIYAFKEEIDQWLKDKDAIAFERKKHKNKKILLPVILSIVILIIAILLFLLMPLLEHESKGPTTFSVDRNIIHVRNSKGEILWNIDHGNNINERGLKYVLDIGNIDNDPQKEVIACTYDILHKDKYAITLFDHDGRVIWKRMMSPKYAFSEIEIKKYFRPSPVKFARSKTNEILIISKWVHMERFLSIIACHNLEGDLVSQYHHTGQLDTSLSLIDVDGDGCVEIVFVGTNNLLNNEGIIGVLPLNNFHGISPPYRIEPEYSHLAFRLKKYLADEIVRGNQLIYIRFKRTDLLPKYKSDIINTIISYFSDNIIHIDLYPWIIKQESETKRLGFDYVFDKNFTLKHVLTHTGDLKMYHDLLKKEDLDIPLEELVNIYKKIIFRWEPGSERWVPVKSTISD